MASASRNDHEPAAAVTTPQMPGKRSRRVLRQIWWTSVPIWSFGLLSFVPFLAFAVVQRRKKDWAVFAGYLVATVALVATLGLVNVNSDTGSAAAGFQIVLMGCAAIHACILFRPGGAKASPEAAERRNQEAARRRNQEAARRRNQEAVVGARSRIERRNDARRIFETNPALARELRIGRPDLPRQYDDGGLTDVNRVPGYVLAASLGLTAQEVTNLVAARDKLGKFGSADELRDYAELPPGRVDELRDLVIFS